MPIRITQKKLKNISYKGILVYIVYIYIYIYYIEYILYIHYYCICYKIPRSIMVYTDYVQHISYLVCVYIYI